jgi:DNA gyrase subunit A
LIIQTAQLSPKATRTTQGVAVMTLKPKYKLTRVQPLEESGVVQPARYRAKNLPAAGALLRDADLEEKQISMLE